MEIQVNKFRPLTIAAVIMAMAGAGAAQAQAQNSQASKPASAGMSRQAQQLSEQDRDFMKNAAEANKAEVQASQLAVRKATDPAVKDFAQTMIDDHTKAQDRLQKIGKDKGVQLPSEPSTAQKSKLDELRAANGSEFDRKFSENIGIEAHHKAIDLFRKESDKGRDPDVKSFAETTLPKLEHHLQIAQNMQAKVERGPNNVRAAGAAASSMAGSNALQAGKDVSRSGNRMSKSEKADELKDAQQNIGEAVKIVQKMKLDPELRGELQKAKGLFILPNYGRAALGVGGQGGEGVLVTHEGRNFSNPVFYDMGGVSLGLQAGASGGEVAMLLMTDRAVQDFKSGKKFSLNADAGLTIVSFSARAQASAGKVQDVIVWSNTKGAYAGASVAVTDVVLDKDANRAYYGKEGLSPAQIIDGKVQSPRKNELGQVLASL